MKILVTRPEPDASALGERLRDLGHEPVIEPLTVFRLLQDGALPVVGIQAVVATSRNGLRALENNASREELTKLSLFAVGEATAAFGRSLGFTDVVTGHKGGQVLADLICEHCNCEQGKLLHLAGLELAFDLKGALETRGFHILAPAVYEMVAIEGISAETQRKFAEKEIDSVILLSPRAARLFTLLTQQAGISDFQDGFMVLCLSKQISELVDIQGEIRIIYPPSPNLDEVLALVN